MWWVGRRPDRRPRRIAEIAGPRRRLRVGRVREFGDIRVFDRIGTFCGICAFDEIWEFGGNRQLIGRRELGIWKCRAARHERPRRRRMVRCGQIRRRDRGVSSPGVAIASAARAGKAGSGAVERDIGADHGSPFGRSRAWSARQADGYPSPSVPDMRPPPRCPASIAESGGGRAARQRGEDATGSIDRQKTLNSGHCG